jgi:arylsulfatase A-like enzyme
VTRPAPQRRGRARAAAAVVAVALAAAVAPAGARAPLDPAVGVVRLGPRAGHLTLDGITRPLAAVDRAFEARPPAGGRGVLHVAAALVPPGPLDATASAVCDVRETRGDGAGVLASLALDHRRYGWVEARIDVAGADVGTLRFACRPAGGAMPRTVWARPLLQPRDADPRGAPLVVLVSLDTLRADHVWGFGGRASWTPALARLGEEGMRFLDATAEATWTLPSHFALLFSRLYGFPLGEHRLVALAEGLADRGYATAAFTAGGFVAASFGFGEGFDHYAEFDAGYTHAGSDVLAFPGLLAAAEGWLDRFSATPAFLFLHTYAVHQQTLDEVEWAARYAALAPLVPQPPRLGEARRQYRRLVRRTDRALSPLLERLRRESATRPVVVVVLSDHGEAFGEHGNFRHGDTEASVTLHDEIVRIPLLLWGPGVVAPGVSRRPTMLIDVAPTLLEAAGGPVPPSMVGTSLWPLLDARPARNGSPAVGGGPSLTRGARGWALRSASRKLIVEPEAVELYDLRRDPGERRNVAHRYPRAAAALHRRLVARVSRLGGTPPPMADDLPVCPLCASADMTTFFKLVRTAQHKGVVDIAIDDATRERLRLLGYVDF